MKQQYNRLSHSIWLCTYHIVFCPKYRFNISSGKTEALVRNELYVLCRQKGVRIEEINIQPDHVHMIYAMCVGPRPTDTHGFSRGYLSQTSWVS